MITLRLSMILSLRRQLKSIEEISFKEARNYLKSRALIKRTLSLSIPQSSLSWACVREQILAWANQSLSSRQRATGSLETRALCSRREKRQEMSSKSSTLSKTSSKGYLLSRRFRTKIIFTNMKTPFSLRKNLERSQRTLTSSRTSPSSNDC